MRDFVQRGPRPRSPKERINQRIYEWTASAVTWLLAWKNEVLHVPLWLGVVISVVVLLLALLAHWLGVCQITWENEGGPM